MIINKGPLAEVHKKGRKQRLPFVIIIKNQTNISSEEPQSVEAVPY